MGSFNIAAVGPLQRAFDALKVVQHLGEAISRPDAAAPAQSAANPSDRRQVQPQAVGDELDECVHAEPLADVDQGVLDGDSAGVATRSAGSVDLVAADEGTFTGTRATVVRHPHNDLADRSLESPKKESSLTSDRAWLPDRERRCPDPLLERVMPGCSVIEAAFPAMPVAVIDQAGTDVFGEAKLIRLTGGEPVALRKCMRSRSIRESLSTIHTSHCGPNRQSVAARDVPLWIPWPPIHSRKVDPTSPRRRKEVHFAPWDRAHSRKVDATSARRRKDVHFATVQAGAS